MFRANRIDASRACAFVIDLQEKLLPLIHDQEHIVAASCKLLDGLRIFELPVLATQQYSKGIGPTVEAIRSCLESSQATLLEKLTFSACDEEAVRSALRKMERPQVIVIGIEAHVCVQQTVLDLRSMDYDVFVCADAVGSRGAGDYQYALARMRQEGAYVTTVESVLFELCHRCDTERFKAMLNIIKATDPGPDQSAGS